VLRATFLGHQGWQLSTERTHLLVDPLLTEGFGHRGLAGRVFPPRRFDFEAMPSIDAVWLTHEHDDHFDLPSLRRLDRSVPVYVSSRSSVALRGVLADLGFTVHVAEPDSITRIGGLCLRTFAADHRTTPSSDEWDVLPFLATDDVGHGAFASSVDAPMPEAVVNAIPDVPWILCMANNTTDVRFVRHAVGTVVPTDDTNPLAAVLARRWRRHPKPPTFTAITGGGWSHPEDVAWIDRLAFSVDPDRLATALSTHCHAPVRAVRPGDQLTLDQDGLTESRATWIETSNGRRPPPGPVDVPDDIGPACGVRTLADWAPLDSGLRELARYLFARSFFAAAHSTASPTPLGLWLRDDAGDRMYAWRPNAADFQRTEADPDAFLCGLRLWATDLLGLFEGDLAPSAICYTGRVRCWNRDPDRLRVDPHLLWSFAHPLHRPHVARRMYDHLLG